jgi:putative methionine-R-sulfoxide reductase with GAF domain
MTDSRATKLDTSAAEDRLRDLQALTDVRLGHLAVEDLLVELLDRVLGILEADTAAVLLLDERSNELVARAARGIEEEVRQGVRIPVGRGFAGRVAAEKQAVILDHVDDTTVTNPLLWEAGIQVMLGVPLLAAGGVIGVLHVGRKDARPFTAHDAELLHVVADRVAGATHARELELERAAARVLQRSLLPSALPRISDLELAARYMPAGGGDLGGDWYDAFTLRSGQVWVVTGDVAGHGFRAAVVMGRLRSTIRAYALEERSPEQVLELADHKLQHFEPEEMATVACAVASPPFDSVRLAIAGHLPPVLAAPGELPALLELDTGPPLGASDHRRASTVVTLAPGAVLLLYTDGLVERRTEPLDAGFNRLLASVGAEHPEIVCRRAIDGLIGPGLPADDVALIAARRSIESGRAPPGG